MYSKWLLQNTNLDSKTIQDYDYWVQRIICNQDIFNQLWLENKLLEIKTTYKDNSVKVIFSAIKHYLSYINNTTIKIPKQRSQQPVLTYSINYEEVNRIQNELIFNNNWISQRNKLLFLFLFKTGLRISELINLKWNNVAKDYIVIKGKGRKYRQVPISKQMYQKLIDLKCSKDFVFCTYGRQRLSYSALFVVLNKTKKQLMLSSKITFHSFRRGFATYLFQNKIPINMISKLLGHSSIQTTEIYLKYDLSNIRSELEKIGFI